MRKTLVLLAVIAMLIPAYITAAIAGEMKTVTLDVDKMTCNMCPVTVKKALKQVDGVAEVVAKYEGEGNGWVKVTYDPVKTNVDTLTNVTKEAGYPSRVKP